MAGPAAPPCFPLVTLRYGKALWRSQLERSDQQDLWVPKMSSTASDLVIRGDAMPRPVAIRLVGPRMPRPLRAC